MAGPANPPRRLPKIRRQVPEERPGPAVEEADLARGAGKEWEQARVAQAGRWTCSK